MFFGADKLPDIARGLGKGMRTLRDATNDIKGEITKSVDSHKGEASEATKSFTDEVKKVKDDLEDITGSIKRKF